jgi:hypothetical protein
MQAAHGMTARLKEAQHIGLHQCLDQPAPLIAKETFQSTQFGMGLFELVIRFAKTLVEPSVSFFEKFPDFRNRLLHCLFCHTLPPNRCFAFC